MKDLSAILQSIVNPAIPINEEGLSEDNMRSIIGIKQRLILLDQLQTKDTKELNEELRKSQKQTFKIIKELKASLESTLIKNEKNHTLAIAMFTLTFLLGFVLIGVAVYFGVQGQQVLSIAFGSFGIINIIAHLIADPPLKVQDSTSNYAQLTAASLTWFSDFVDKSAMLGANNQLGAQIQGSSIDVNSRLIVQEKILNNYLVLSGAQIDNTVRILRLIEEIAEPSNRKKQKSRNNENEAEGKAG